MNALLAVDSIGSMSDVTVSIYALCQPETGEVRYVGKSTDVDRRYCQHLAPWNLAKKSKKNSWLKSLLARSVEPMLVVLEEVPAEEAGDVERWWIDCYRLGRLTNGTAGGEGNQGMSAEARARMGLRKFNAGAAREIRERFAAGETTVELAEEFGVTRHTVGNVVRGKTWPEAGGPITTAIARRWPKEAGEAARLATLGRQRSEETKKKISEATRGQARPSMQGEQHHQARLTISQVLEIRARAEHGEGFRELGRAYGVSHITIRRIVLRETWVHV
jgi:DNA invertase Pin-like site-specific DNA recombinase